MDRTRFDAIIDAYGADPRRWPAAERAAAETFYAEAGGDISQAAALDEALDAARETPDVHLLAARVLKQRRALRSEPDKAARWALAACAMIGVAAGFGAGAMVAPAASVEPGRVLSAALTAPFESTEDGGE